MGEREPRKEWKIFSSNRRLPCTIVSKFTASRVFHQSLRSGLLDHYAQITILRSPFLDHYCWWTLPWAHCFSPRTQLFIVTGSILRPGSNTFQKPIESFRDRRLFFQRGSQHALQFLKASECFEGNWKTLSEDIRGSKARWISRRQ